MVPAASTNSPYFSLSLSLSLTHTHTHKIAPSSIASEPPSLSSSCDIYCYYLHIQTDFTDFDHRLLVSATTLLLLLSLSYKNNGSLLRITRTKNKQRCQKGENKACSENAKNEDE